MPNVQKILDAKPQRVIDIPENGTVLEAARRMNEHRIGALVVTRGQTVVGIFTERDILCRVVAAQRDPGQTTVDTVMTTPVAVCTPQTTWDECRSVMRHKRLRHLPVVTGEKLVGMISIGDLYEADEAAREETIRYLHDYLYGEWK
jgi:CBS domain-containing protein